MGGPSPPRGRGAAEDRENLRKVYSAPVCRLSASEDDEIFISSTFFDKKKLNLSLFLQ